MQKQTTRHHLHLLPMIQTPDLLKMKNLVDWFYWIPRLLSLAAILFISMFALDSFAPGLTVWQQIGGFLIHLIPSYLLIAALLVAWKWEKIGGIIFMVIGMGFSPFVFLMNYHRTGSVLAGLGVVLIINVPFIMVGALFWLSHYLRKNSNPS